MKIEISATEAARQFGDCLARVKYRGDSFIISKNGEPVAELTGLGAGRGGTVGELRNSLSRLPVDASFADDLAIVDSMDQLPENPWS